MLYLPVFTCSTCTTCHYANSTLPAAWLVLGGSSRSPTHSSVSVCVPATPLLIRHKPQPVTVVVGTPASSQAPHKVRTNHTLQSKRIVIFMNYILYMSSEGVDAFTWQTCKSDVYKQIILLMSKQFRDHSFST